MEVSEARKQIDSVARSPVFPYLGGMEVHFNPDLEVRLTQRAAQQGRSFDEMVQDVVTRYFEEEGRLSKPLNEARPLWNVATF